MNTKAPQSSACNDMCGYECHCYNNKQLKIK